MIEWLIKIGTPGWGGNRSGSERPWRWTLRIGRLIDLALTIFCVVSMVGALSADDYAKATFWLVLGFIVSRSE